MDINSIYKIFTDLTGVKFYLNQKNEDNLINYLSYFHDKDSRNKEDIFIDLIKSINIKLGLNKKEFKFIIDTLAKEKLTFNYWEKNKIEDNLNSPQINLDDFFSNYEIKNKTKDKVTIKKITPSETIEKLHEVINEDKNSDDILNSIFSSFVFYFFDKEKTYKVNSGREFQPENYYQFIIENKIIEIENENGLSIVDLSEENIDAIDKKEIFFNVNEAIDKLQNNRFLSIILPGNKNKTWELTSDLIFFCEKKNEAKIKYKFHNKELIFNKTKKYIKYIDRELFDNSNIGLHYKDNYIIETDGTIKYSVLLFEKNDIDESKIPCPSCRSMKIQGNSFPKLGVRSWECKNPFCYDKSKYNRGKRYSISSILRQESINFIENKIEKDLLKKWRRDIVSSVDKSDLIYFLIKTYSLSNDSVVIYCNKNGQSTIEKRNVVYMEMIKSHHLEFDPIDSSFIKKSIYKNMEDNMSTEEPYSFNFKDKLRLINGDSRKELKKINDNYFDGAITSPPYYNAREYSTWENIHCYLYDIYNIAQEIFRTLKPGSYFLYNIFDYFDNENDIVLSDMGKKRISLSAYTSIIFRKIGFEHDGCVIWDKGEIQGNRNFNQGNDFPFYQAPLNCWEHVMIFRKSSKSKKETFPNIIRVPPVRKIYNGKNIHGHSAPFPKEIPELLLNNLSKNSIILDPFSGSSTTGRAAIKKEIKSILIEKSMDYFILSKHFIQDELVEHHD